MTTMLLQISWLPFILLTCLSGCVATSDFLSGPTSTQNSGIEPSSLREPIQIGVSSQTEVKGMLGDPTDRQIHSENGNKIESWAYASHDETVTPYQYILFFGAVASPHSLVNESPSVAISFSPNGVASGLTLSTLNAYGDIPPPELFPISAFSPPLYGMRNPQISHSPRATNSHFP
jgi:hypothetical protein